MRAFSISSPSSIITARRTASALGELMSRLEDVLATNIAETEFLPVAHAVCSISSPSGSPTAAHLRVETPAKPRSCPGQIEEPRGVAWRGRFRTPAGIAADGRAGFVVDAASDRVQ